MRAGRARPARLRTRLKGFENKDDFAVIYRILSALQKQMDYDEPNPDVVSADALNITQNRLDNIWAMLSQEKYVSGIMVNNYDNTRMVKPVCPRITLKGLEYLADNSLMKKAYRLAKGLKDVTPFV